ncbi:MAG: sulfotransferase [Victivallales bacterium]|nr:sulfotransferase [Victivallales bacterium]
MSLLKQKKKPIYIGIVRHGLDVVCSLSEFNWGIIQRNMRNGESKYIACLKVWCEMNNMLLKFQKKVKDRLLLIKYEDLTEAPKIVVQNIFKFIGEKMEINTLEFSSFFHDYGYGDKTACAYKKTIKNSQKYLKLPLELQRELFDFARETFQKLEYTI